MDNFVDIPLQYQNNQDNNDVLHGYLKKLNQIIERSIMPM